MTTWTMEQVRQVGALRAEVTVDLELVDRYGDAVLNDAAQQMAKCIADMAHPLGVDVDPTRRDEFEIVWERTDGASPPWVAKGRLRWNPTTNTAELRNGHLDGERYVLKNIGDPFRVPRPAMTPCFDESDQTASEIADVYELVGWREDEHVWVYQAK